METAESSAGHDGRSRLFVSNIQGGIFHGSCTAKEPLVLKCLPDA